MMPNLFGLSGTEIVPVDTLVDGFLDHTPDPTAAQLQGFFSVLTTGERPVAARLLIDRGVDPALVSAAQSALISPAARSNLLNYLTVASAAACGYHGYKRNQSIWWSAVWFGMGIVLPVITPVVALAQGYGREKR